MKINMNMLKLLPFALAGDLLLPFLFAPFYRGYSHITQVMSLLGNRKAPLHILYNSWLVLLGILILAANFSIFSAVAKQSKGLAAVLVCVLTVYAAGGCILSGIFPVGETKSLVSLSEKIHGYGSVIGFMLLTAAPALIGVYFLKAGQLPWAALSGVSFILAAGFFVLFVMADKPQYQGTAVAYEGLWQRLTLLFMYLPVSFVCLKASAGPRYAGG